jgi:hypothetical protein
MARKSEMTLAPMPLPCFNTSGDEENAQENYNRCHGCFIFIGLRIRSDGKYGFIGSGKALRFSD